MNKISLNLLGALIKRYGTLILILSLFSSITILGFSNKIIQKKYSAINQLVISPKDNLSTFDLKYISTYKELIDSEQVLGQVSEKLENKNINFTIQDLRSGLIVNASNDSQIITLEFISTNKSQVSQVVNTIGTIANDTLPKIITTNDVALLQQTNKINEVATLSEIQLFIIVYTLSAILFFSMFVSRLLFSRKVYLDEQIKDILNVDSIYTIKKLE